MWRNGLRKALALTVSDSPPSRTTGALFFGRGSLCNARRFSVVDRFLQAPESLSTILDGKKDSLDHTPPPGLNGTVLRLLGYYSKESIHIRGARRLYEQIISRSDDESFLSKFGLPENFRTTYSMLVLHMWMTLYRLRKEGSDGSDISQTLYEIFMRDCEKRVFNAGVKVLISKWMKELKKNFYGACSAYDKAILLPPSSTELSKSLWRNVFAEDGSEMPTGSSAEPIHALARYVRREIASLNLTDGESVKSGYISFSSYNHHMTGCNP